MTRDGSDACPIPVPELITTPFVEDTEQDEVEAVEEEDED